MTIILGIIISIVGAFITIKSETVLNIFGRNDFFEKYLGAEGGSRLGYKLLGIFAFFIGTLMFTGLIGDFMNWILSPLIDATRRTE